MKAGRPHAFVVVLDGTTGAAARQARALGSFLRDGVSRAPEADGGPAEATGITLLFYADERDRERLVRLAPTRDVHLMRVPPRRPDLMAAALEALAGDAGAELFVFAGGPLGTELATRLACRTGGGVATDALDAHVGKGALLCHRQRLLGPPHRTRRTRPAAPGG